MLKWCAYCQEFQGEVPDYDDLAMTHGICEHCLEKGPEFPAAHVKRGRKLKEIQAQLRVAGRNEDLVAAARIVDEASTQGVRSVDVLMGMIAPLLFQVGEDWRGGAATVAEEHRFTSFCERLFDLIDSRVLSANRGRPQPQGGATMILNAPGNRHSLGIRILAHAIRAKGLPAVAVFPDRTRDELTEAVTLLRPRNLLISVALAEQRKGAVEIVELVESLSAETRPRIFVGGYAVRLGMIEPIPGAELMADISELSLILSDD